MKIIRLVLTILVLTVGTGHALAASNSDAERAFSRGDPVPAWVRPTTVLPPPVATSALSVRLADVQFYAAPQSTVYAHRAITAHEASSLGSLGQFEIEFQPEYQRVQLHRLRILRGRETIDKLKAATIRFLQRETALDRGIYSGSFTAAVVTEDVRVGDTLEIQYSVVGDNPVFDGKFFDSAHWDSPEPLSLRRVTMNSPEDNPIHFRLIGADQRPLPTPTETNEGGRNIRVFEVRNLQPLIGEPAVPSDVHAARWIQFSAHDSWSGVNAWALDLFAHKATSPAMQAALKSARAARTQDEAVVRVLEFVQAEIRYLSVSLGENSHRPFPPDQVLARRYGDCKDKSLLMVSMLRELNIEAAPVLVSTYFKRGLDKLLPSPILFDHAIVRVTLKGKHYYLDPTRMGQHGSLENLGQSFGGYQVLAITPGTAALSTIPLPAQPPVMKRTERVSVSAMDQPAEMTVRLTMRGVDAEGTRVQMASTSKVQLRKSFESFLVKRYPDAQLVGEPVLDDDRAANTYSMEARYRIARLFKSFEGGYSMRYEESNMNDVFYPTGSARREFPYAIPNAPSRTIYEFEMTLPETYALTSASSTQKVDNPAFTFVKNSYVGGRIMRSSSTLELLADRVAPADMQVMLADMQKMNENSNGGFRVHDSDLKGYAKGSEVASPATATAAAPPPASAAITIEAQLRTSLAGISRAVADAELTGRDASAALCERALVHAWLGQSADAQKDAARAVQLQPRSTDMLRCRAEVGFATGNFKDSEKDYASAIARGADSADMYFGRGLASLYLDKSADARADFGLAADKGEGSTQARAAAWHAIASTKQAGQMSTRARSAASDPESLWLAAVPAMFSGQQTPEHVLGLASRNAGRDLDRRLTEAYYYSGKYYLIQNDKLRARAYLQRAVDKKVLNSVFAIAARHELGRMAPWWDPLESTCRHASLSIL